MLNTILKEMAVKNVHPFPGQHNYAVKILSPQHFVVVSYKEKMMLKVILPMGATTSFGGDRDWTTSETLGVLRAAATSWILLLTLILPSESVYGSQFFFAKLLQVHKN